MLETYRGSNFSYWLEERIEDEIENFTRGVIQ
jgi:hypothetical protein